MERLPPGEHPAVLLASRTVDLAPEEARSVAEAWGVPRTVPAGTVLLRPGDRCRTLWLLADGYARFFAEPDGRDVTRHFVLPGQLFTAYPAYTSGAPSNDGLQTLTDARLHEVSRERAERLAASIPPWDAFRTDYVAGIYAYLDRALDRARTLTTAERYAAFEREQAGVLLNVPLRYVASYLGMTPQSLSRVRAQR